MSGLVEQTRAEVRFALSQLAAGNGHHEFEALARALARATVTRNVLPATGPVSVGGDQGRDFETYVTQLAGQVQAIGANMGLTDGDGVAFACTLQQSDIASKIRADIKAILTTGTPVQLIVYYCEANVPVAIRHRLQDEARKQSRVQLEIFDGTAIAEVLSQHATFWIAESFLSLPARTLPPPPDRPDWYELDLSRWQQRTPPASTWGDYVDLAGCVRYAYGARDGREDLPFWLGELEPLLDPSTPKPLKHAARHQTVLATHLGLGAMRQADSLVADEISDALISCVPTDLSDATVLLMLTVSAFLRGETDHTAETIDMWGTKLDGTVDELLGSSDNANDIASLLQSSIALKLRPDLRQLPPGEATPFIEDPTASLTPNERLEAIATGGAVPAGIPSVNMPGAWNALVTLIDHLPEVPLFPAAPLADFLAINARLLFDQPDFDHVSSRLDARIAKTLGDAAAADNALARASALFDAGQYLRGLTHLHRARNNLVSGESAERMVQAALATAAAYRELNLNAASKYFGLVAAALAGTEGGDLYARGLFAAAAADYHQGNWLNATILNREAVIGHGLLAERSFDFEVHEWLNKSMFELVAMRALARKVGPPLQSFLDDATAEAGVSELLDSLLEGAAALSSNKDWRPWWDDLDVEEFQAKCVREFGQPAFSDAGPQRELRFMCLGVHWRVQFANQPDAVLAAERFAAVLQIALAHLSDWDPALLPTSVTVCVSVTDGETAISEAGSTPTETRFECGLQVMPDPACMADHDVMVATLGAATTVIVAVSTRDDEAWKEALDRAAEDGLFSNIQFAMPYDVASRSTRAVFSEQILEASVQSTGYQPAGPGLEAPGGPGPGYSTERSHEEIRFRYEDLPGRINSTLPGLQQDEDFQRRVDTLRSRGWRDWHILIAVVGVAKNTRLKFRGGVDTEDTDSLKEFFLAPEPPGDPVPARFFTLDQLEFLLKVNLTPFSTVAWNFALRQQVIDVDAVEQILCARYGWMTDDVSHDDPFRAQLDRTPDD